MIDLAKINRWFSQPYPGTDSVREEIITAAVLGLFVSSFLFLLRPFGLHHLEMMDALRHTIVFGLLTFVVTLGYELFSRYVLQVEYDKPSYTFGRWLVHTSILIFLIGIVNFLFLVFYLKFTPFSWFSFMMVVLNTFLVGVFPTVFIGALNLRHLIQRNTKTAQSIEIHHQDLQHVESAELIELASGQEVIEVNPAQIIYVEAMQNYVALHSQSTDRPIIIRSTMKNIADQLSGYEIIKVHRSYLVNTAQISAVSGNAQGLKLTLSDSNIVIPVSRSYIPVVREMQL